MDEKNIKQKTITGVQWTLCEKIVTVSTSFICTIILARILGPSNYGIIGIVSIFIFVFQGIVDSGFSAALIRKESVSEDDYSTAFFFNLVVSIFLYLVLIFSSSSISHFFNTEVLSSLLKVMGIVLIINAICITQVTKLSRNIDFKTQAIISIISSIMSGGIGVIMAFSGCGVWSIVAQQIVQNLSKCILLCSHSKWMPSFRFSMKSFNYLFDFGWKILVSNIITNIWVQGNKIIIGKMYDNTTLGFYTKAKDLPHQVISNVGSIISNVSYPVLSTLHNDTVSLKSAYRRVLKITFFISAIICLGISAISNHLIFVLFGENWMNASSYLQIISIAYIFTPVITITLSVLKIYNRTDLFLLLEIISKSIAVIPFVLGIKYGLWWLIWGSVCLSLIQFLLDSYFSGKQINYSLIELLKDLLPSIIVSFVMFFSVKVLSFIHISSYILLPILVLVGAGIVIFMSTLLKIQEYQECVSFTKSLFVKIIQKRIR